MGVILHLLKLTGADTFEDNAQQVFLPYVLLHLKSLLEMKSYRVGISHAVLFFLFQRGDE